MTAMTFLVTGGSGFMGINLVRYLLGHGHNVRSYDLQPFIYPEKDRIDELQGDIRNRDLHDRAFDGVDVVVHCAAALPLAKPDEIRSTNVDGTRLLLETAEKNGIARFIHTSSTAVYGIPDHHPLLEIDAMHGVGAYGESKVAAEHVCLEYRDRGLCLPILRPKSFVGPERLGAFELLYDFAYSGHNFPVLGSGNNVYQLMDVEDLSQAVLLCATKDTEIVNETFNVGAGEYGSLRQAFQAVLDEAGHKKNIISFPERPAIWTLRALEAVHLSPLYKWIYETAGKDSFVSIKKITEQLGYSPVYSNETALVRNYEWYVANHDSISRTPGVSHRVPWKKGALKMLKMIM